VSTEDPDVSVGPRRGGLSMDFWLEDLAAVVRTLEDLGGGGGVTASE
jgi:hypothetical protein